MTAVPSSLLTPTCTAGGASLQASPHPWTYNPSAWNQRIPICLVAIVGFVLAVYMALYQWRLIDQAWDPVFAGNP
ncbi:MAG TPA: hypothetical protein VML55_22995, partial [Planctomycetaceae bacterium]|nr:hypothetical protein [Planctomycetaceae bacterium]